MIQSLSDHQLGGKIRTSTKYNFEGQPTLTLTSGTNTGVGDILRAYNYNVIGQLAYIDHTIDGTTRRIVQNTYNDLGQLKTKAFPEITLGNQTYSYNIRGWLKTLGSSLPDGYTQTNYYQESGATTPRWNGNISRINWGGKAGDAGTFKTRTYNYVYDNANRLKAANYSASSESNWFSVNGITYDANGDIYSMIRRNQRASGAYNVVDNLEYSYHRFSNRLSQVKDNIAAVTYTAKDFKERGTTEYGYDENGNMTENVDKQISLITYNHLNLPREITFSTGGQLRFAYDAAGNKLTQKVYNSSGVLTRTQDYIGEIVLLDGELDYLLHEEGRLVAEQDELWGEYYLKDHLGNIRQVLRESESQVYIATMESGRAATEEIAFSMISESRQTEPEHNVTVGGNQVAWLNANRGRMVGPGRTQEIYAGDSLKLQVHGKYLEDKKQKANAASFMAAGGKERLGADLNELALSTQRAGGANPIVLLNLADILAKDLQKKAAPEAYLMYALYDQDSNRYEIGKKVLTKNAANQHEVLEENMYISKDGYMETFVVNETSEDVWFDNMMVMSTTPVIVQETHYDPWGLELTGLGFQYGGIKANKYLYQGKEMMDDQNLNIYDFHARGYDPVIGRTLQLDPMADSYYPWSPYAWTMNDPIKYMDPTGMFSTHTDEDGNVVAVYDDGDLGVYRHQGKVIKSDIDAFHRADNTSANGKKMGETLVWWSFADPKDGDNSGGGLGRIDFSSYDARDWLNSTEPGGLLDYVTNAGTGADQRYDYKSQGLSSDATPSEAANHQYRGSQIAPGVYASARDVGNIFAGMYGSLFGTAKHPVLKAMGAFNANQNKLNGALAGQLFQNWRAPYGEDFRSHYMQDVGFDMGKSNALFRNKFGVK